jgi:FKBP-type peptidyl-prolyl cis-trans isomerase 2
VRRISAAAALLLVPALLVTGCSSSSKAKSASPAASAPAASPSASPSAVPVPPVVTDASGLPTVTGAFGSSAEVKLPSGAPISQFVVHPLIQGTGPAAGSTDLSVINFTVADWTSGKVLTTAYSPDNSGEVFNPAQGSIPALQKAVAGQKAGTRVLVVAPPGAATAQMSPNEPAGVTAKDTLVFVVDVNQVIASKADIQGTQSPSPAGMPSVVAPTGKAATFTIPADARTPKSLEIGVLIKGTGPKVKSGQTIVAQYTGATLANGKVFDSSWNDAGATAFAVSSVTGQSQVIPGWNTGLIGQTVGSRVLLSIPAAQAYGASPPSGSNIPANADLVFVVDILAAA